MDYLLHPFTSDFMLPGDITFDDFVDTVDHTYVKRHHLLYMPMYGILLLVLRKLYEKHVATRLAGHLQIQNKRKPLLIDARLERLYAETKHPDQKRVSAYAKRLDMDERSVRRWFRRRRNHDRPDLVNKFKETSWRFLFYTVAFCYGLATLIQTPWFWDTSMCWTGFPMQPLWMSIYYYYMIEGGFYMSLLYSLGMDNKRKDFYEQIIHHLATIFLITFSYACNFIRAGSLVMIVHDLSDVLLEVAKCAHYAERRRLADNLFTSFAVVFIISRLLLFPRVVLYSTLVESLLVTPPYSGYYFLNVLLVVLQLLHIFWSITIVRMAYDMLVVGVVRKDDRSDVEEKSSDEDEAN